MLFTSSASNDCECTNTLAHKSKTATRPFLLLFMLFVQLSSLDTGSSLVCGTRCLEGRVANTAR